MIYDEVALWGLTDESPIEEVWETTFKYLDQQNGTVSISTVSHGRPQSRVSSLMRFGKDQGIYFMTSKGKPYYKQLKENPYISIASIIDDPHHAIRIQAKAVENFDPEIRKEHDEQNPGTLQMYRHNPDLMTLFKLESGFIEIFHLYRNDMVRRLRFGFGGEEPRPLTYYITDNCIGCGECYNHCAEKAIYKLDNGQCRIRPMDCDDCGICYTKCPIPGVGMRSRILDDEDQIGF